MGGRSARTKGHGFERQIAQCLRHLDPSAKRNVTETQEGSFDITTDLPLAIQCKCFSRWHTSPHDVYAQAADAAGELMPVAVVRIDRKKPDLAILSWDDFISILEILNETKCDT